MARRTKGVGADPMVDALMDEIDEERARRLRREFGQRRWILSWMPTENARWMARVSGPGHPDTVERTGRTRAEAIVAASRFLEARLIRIRSLGK